MNCARSLLILASAIVLLLTTTSFADSRDWSLRDIDGQSFSLSAQTPGTPTMLIFWATWCAPCKKELDHNQKLFESFSDMGLRILMIAEDNSKTQSRVKPYVTSKGFKWQVLLDPAGDLLKRYGGTSLPYTVFLDSNGNTVSQFRGEARDQAELTKQVNALLGGKGE